MLIRTTREVKIGQLYRWYGSTRHKARMIPGKYSAGQCNTREQGGALDQFAGTTARHELESYLGEQPPQSSV